ncbi:MAG: hypothetical protein HY721_05325, partial [Planctomycetes bacterium]|nr:hypothetical protein [Planctomycetota bacterium]
LLVERGTTLRFRFRAAGSAPAGLRLSVAGLGDVQVPLAGPEAPGAPVLLRPEGLRAGEWADVRLDLRPALDAVAASKGIAPAQARTTWDDDWVVTAVRFARSSDPGGAGTGDEVYEFEGVEAAGAAPPAPAKGD